MPGADRRMLGRAVAAVPGDAGAVGARHRVGDHRRRAEHEIVQGQVDAPALGDVEHGVEEDRGADRGGDRVAQGQLDGVLGVPGIHRYRGAAVEERARHGQRAGDVAGRPAVEEDRVPVATELGGHGGQLGEQGVMAVHHTFGCGRRARGVQQQAGVVGVPGGSRRGSRGARFEVGPQHAAWHGALPDGDHQVQGRACAHAGDAVEVVEGPPGVGGHQHPGA